PIRPAATGSRCSRSKENSRAGPPDRRKNAPSAGAARAEGGAPSPRSLTFRPFSTSGLEAWLAGDAFAWRRPALVQLHSYAGLANGLGMMYYARRGYTPMVVIAGEAGLRYEALD